ncbi:MAG: hypothetical protein J6A73_06260 [Lachnospiraceae bacterium]|nr:hypothetical protein [Lachnospiraceae bacterium]
MKKKMLEQYKELGAMFRTYKTMAVKLSVNASNFLTKAKWQKLQKAVDTVGSFASELEDKMFEEHPELTDEYVDVFYGATTNEPRNELDAEMVTRAKAFCKTLF